MTTPDVDRSSARQCGYCGHVTDHRTGYDDPCPECDRRMIEPMDEKPDWSDHDERALRSRGLIE